MKKPFDRSAPIDFAGLLPYVTAVQFGNSHVHLMGATNTSGKTFCGKQPGMPVKQVAKRVNCGSCCAGFRDGQRI